MATKSMVTETNYSDSRANQRLPKVEGVEKLSRG